MAQKATKALAARNAAALRRLHLTALGVHAFFLILRFWVRWSRETVRTFWAYGAVTVLSLAIELFLERSARPAYNMSGDVTRAGADLDAPGLTEYLWDVLYWTWGTIVAAAVLGDRAWWAWVAVPLYSAWAAWRAVGGVRESLGGLAGAGADGSSTAGPTSRRQQKMEKRGGQRMQYR